jgi:hypothetical protein
LLAPILEGSSHDTRILSGFVGLLQLLSPAPGIDNHENALSTMNHDLLPGHLPAAGLDRVGQDLPMSVTWNLVYFPLLSPGCTGGHRR